MKAYLKSYRQAPRKVRLVGNLIKGKTAERAVVLLDGLPKRASGPIKKLLLSAVANAKHSDGLTITDLFVKEVRVDQGVILKRSMPRSRGSASPIHKHTSHVMLELIPLATSSDAPKTSPKEEAPKATKVVAKKAPAKASKKTK